MAIDKRGKNTFRFRTMFKGNNYTMTYYGSEKEAKRAHDEFVLDVKKGKFLQASTMTLRELWELYIESKPLEAGTLRAYDSHKKSFNFLDMQVAELSKIFLKNYHNKHQLYGNDDNYTTLKAVLNFGVEMDIIAVNPLSFKLRKCKKAKFQALLSREELKSLIDALENYPDKTIGLFLLTQLYCGLRFGEAAGLTKKRIDTVNHRIEIVEQYKPLTSGKKGLGKLKTESSERVVFIIKPLRARLYEAILPKSDDDFIFQGVDGRPLYYPTVNHAIKDISKGLGLPIMTTHKMRKLASTIALYSDIDPLTISKMLGHSSLDMTEQYLTVIKGEMEKAGEKMGDFVLDLSR